MARTQIIKLVLGIGVACLGGTAVFLLIARILAGTALNEPTTIAVQIEAPAQVTRNEPFAVSIQVSSLVTVNQTLHSIDLDRNYLNHVPLNGSAPAYRAVRTLPLTRFTSYQFAVPLPAQQTTVVELQFVGETVGQFVGVVDICLEDGTLCLAQRLETEVVE